MADPANDGPIPAYRRPKTPRKQRRRFRLRGKGPRGSVVTRAMIPGVKNVPLPSSQDADAELRKYGIDTYDSRRGQL